MYKKNLTKEQALQKLRHYCRYQERCCSEVKNKLFELGVNKTEHDKMVTGLIEENYLNEERFALAFALGRFTMRKWGRRKIHYELKERKVSEEAIQKSLKQIDEELYVRSLQRLAEEKYASLRDEPYLVRKKKTIDYMAQKGFETDLVKVLVEKMVN